jgi:hypothetical protein
MTTGPVAVGLGAESSADADRRELS